MRDVHYDEVYLYDRKDYKTQEFVNDEWHKEDNELFIDLTDIINASKPFSEFNTIPHKSSKNYLYFDESQSCDSTPFSDIVDLIGDKKHHDEGDTNCENEESCLYLNRRDRSSYIPSLVDITRKTFQQDQLTKPIPGILQSARIKDKILVLANIMQ